MSGTAMKGLIVIIGVVVLGLGLHGLVTGQVLTKGAHLATRDDSPVNYWVAVIVYLVAGPAAIVAALFFL